MGKKKKNNNSNNENDNNNGNNEAEKKKKEEEEGDAVAEKKKDDKKSSVTVILKVDMHCEGCANKIVRYARSFEGVEAVKAEVAANKITIVGAVDPSKIREKLDKKTKKKIDLISPQPKKDNKDKEPKQDNKPKDNKSPDDKKPKEPPVTTAVLKLGLHCQGCIEKILKIVSKTKGVMDKSIDKQKDTVTVKGTMDAKALAEVLKERLKRPVEIVPPKKEKEKEKEKEKNDEKESNGGDNNNSGNGGSKKKKGGGGGGGGQEVGDRGGGGGKMEESRMEYFPMGVPGSGYGHGYQIHGGYEYGYPVGGYYHQPAAPQMFSDENPNACVVM
ncbi:hypothetical protein CICLE_v10028824mg [Citrus x clementina]|uniref:Heavy metal-associated isoprenylated plant protein 3 n=2 Tax=Citrus TaxID=2706 RepID=A0ACB8IU41_CITSI|nr:heavy metal-associated isoprenylated plant protein 3 [Citrus x clementina]ESR37731.1 hypothetical protein CICLE_v10028824mg [Citrus x clementina]KAH9700411.1 Heavy metal-associated isoprenylated plant protein 3 [Citrus sinensis]